MAQCEVLWIIAVLCAWSCISCASSSSHGDVLSTEISPDSKCSSHGCMVCHPSDPSSYGTCTQQYIKGQVVLVAMWNHVPPSTSCQQDQTCQVLFVVSKQTNNRRTEQLYFGGSSRQVDVYIKQGSYQSSADASFRRRPLKQKIYHSQELIEPLDSRANRELSRGRTLPKDLSWGHMISMVDDVDSTEKDLYASRPTLTSPKSKNPYYQHNDKASKNWPKKYYEMTRKKMVPQARSEEKSTVTTKVDHSGVFKTNTQPSVPIQYFLSKEMISKIFPNAKNSPRTAHHASISHEKASLTSSTNEVVKPKRPRLAPGLRKRVQRMKPRIAKKKGSRKPSKHVVYHNTAPRNQAKSCRLPECFLPNSGIPGGLDRSETPMLVYFSFDDAVTPWTKSFFDKLFDKSRTNPNGCRIAATHFNSHQNTVYKLVTELYEAGHEIASHSISHRTPTTWWKSASQAEYKEEIVGQKENIHKYANVPLSEIRGMRVPFLQLGKDNQFNMLEKNRFLYDASMSSRSDPPSWPFTLQYPKKIIGGLCSVKPCPVEPHKLWEVPLNNFYMGSDCSSPMVDGCRPATKEAALKYIRRNFQSHYNSPNKPPFGVNMHASWFAFPQNFQAMDDFIEELVSNDDVWIVPIYKVIQWMQDPTPSSQLKKFAPFACNKH